MAIEDFEPEDTTPAERILNKWDPFERGDLLIEGLLQGLFHYTFYEGESEEEGMRMLEQLISLTNSRQVYNVNPFFMFGSGLLDGDATPHREMWDTGLMLEDKSGDYPHVLRLSQKDRALMLTQYLPDQQTAVPDRTVIYVWGCKYMALAMPDRRGRRIDDIINMNAK